LSILLQLSNRSYPYCRKGKKGVQMKRSKNARRMKAIAKAISKNDKYSEKVLKHENKKMRVHSASHSAKSLNNFFGHFD